MISLPKGVMPTEAPKWMIDKGILRTIDEWNREPNMPVVMDPDGFDREDPNLHVRLFTRGQFLDGACRSTVIPAPEEDGQLRFFDETEL